MAGEGTDERWGHWEPAALRPLRLLSEAEAGITAVDRGI